MINFSVSRPPRALILRGQAKKRKKTLLPLPFLSILGPWSPLPGIPALWSIFHADVRGV